MRSGRLGAIVFLISLALGIGILLMVVRIVTPGPPRAEIPARSPLSLPLTKKLALVLLDGVRFDVATDGRRMPRLAERFRANPSAELWAEPISMTSSAALVFGTGAHADIDLAIRNESSQPTLFEDLFTIARGAGLRTGTVGDPVWTELFPRSWDVTRAESHQLAIGISDDDAAFVKAEALRSIDPPVAVGVFHFGNPDHMAHGHGVGSATYETYIANFDRKLATFLDRFSNDTTVIVLGDHGATMAGIHGSDTPEQRRTFLVAHGPGLVAGPHPMPRVDDVDLAPTMTTLLGIAAPRHARGLPLVEWLAVGDVERASLACKALQGLTLSLDTSEGTTSAPACDPGRSARERIAVAPSLARAIDARVDDLDSATQHGTFRLSLFAAGATALLAFLLFFRVLPGPVLARAGLVFALALVASVLVTAHLERLPGAWLTPARVALYLVFNAPLLLWIARGAETSRLLDRVPVLLALLLPGALAFTETHSALIESYLVSAVIAAFVFTRGVPDAEGFPRPWSKDLWTNAPHGVLLLGLAIVCIDAGNFVPTWLLAADRLQLGAAIGSVIAFAIVRQKRLRAPVGAVAALVVLAAASLVLRRVAPAVVCLSGWALLASASAIALLRRRRAIAELLVIASYAWVSRDLEIPLLLASYLVALRFGETIADDRPSRVLTLATIAFVFAWGYVQQVAIQMGIHFMHLDFGAGAFRDAGVSMPRIVFALVYKYSVARGFVLVGVLLPLAAARRLVVLRALVVLYGLRATVLVASLEAARHSFWTPVWVTSELPHVLLGLILVSGVTAYALARAPRSPIEA